MPGWGIPPVTYDLPLPISTNALYRNLEGGGRAKTAKYRAWVECVGDSLRYEQRARPVPGQVFISILVSEKSRCDADNCVKCVFDALVRAGVIEDDRKKFVRGFDMRWSDKTEGMRVTIKPVEGKAV